MRSLLFVPADSDKKLQKAMSSGADALLIDLEDSVAPERKETARACGLAFLRQARTQPPCPKLFVRINGIETGLADLKEALKGDDSEAITAKMNALAQASMKLGEAMYRQAEGAPAGGADGGPGGAKKDDVVDAEFTEVDDDKNTKKSA